MEDRQTSEKERQEELQAWLKENASQLQEATRDGLRTLDRISEMMMDPDISGEELVTQLEEAIKATGEAVMAEHLAESVEKKFANCGEVLRKSLLKNAELMVREHPTRFAQLLRDFCFAQRGIQL